ASDKGPGQVQGARSSVGAVPAARVDVGAKRDHKVAHAVQAVAVGDEHRQAARQREEDGSLVETADAALLLLDLGQVVVLDGGVLLEHKRGKGSDRQRETHGTPEGNGPGGS